jgi:pyruvate-ferredoxin/flavodoxin oxidoreductase
MSKTYKTIDGNEAVASVAYRLSEVSAIYPITPSSNMGEHADEWAAKGKTNLWGTVPSVVEMQSEGGAIGAVHGGLQNGALVTTYTASQGLLLMIPNMYKIAGELTPMVIHVAARSLACQGLSIFGDHSDVMSVRSTGFAMLSAGSVQEAHDMALIAHAATLESRIPFINFFDGFRTSHEVNKIEMLSDDDLAKVIEYEFILAHRKRGLTPDHPVIRGTAQNPDVYFQGRETVNPFYKLVPGIVKKYMGKLADVTGRKYDLVEYYGAADAEYVIVIMGSGAATVKETINYLQKNDGHKIGVLQLHLYRPFPEEDFMAKLPKTVKAIAVLDRTKEPGAIGEPLYQDVITALNEYKKSLTVIGGRYGLSSKEFTPAMVKAIFDELKKSEPKNHFTIGINDDVSFTSLTYDHKFIIESDKVIRAVFYGLGADGTVGANKNSIKIIGEETDNHAQGYFVYDSKKSGSKTISHLRFGPEPIDSPYLIQSANFVAVHQFPFVEKTNVLHLAKEKGVFLLNAPYPHDQVWHHLPKEIQQTIIDKKLDFYVIDAYKVAQAAGIGTRINTVMQVAFFALANVLPKDEAIAKIKEYIRKSYIKKGEDVVAKNFKAVDGALAELYKVVVPASVSADAKPIPKMVSDDAPDFIRNVTARMMMEEGDELPVSAMPIDGTFPCGTTKWEKRNVSLYIAGWDPETCIQCGQCSFVCPHGVIRAKKYNKELLKDAPEGFKSASVRGKGNENDAYTLQVYLEDCTGCALCNQVCPAKNKEKVGDKAINMVVKEPILEQEQKSIEFFEKIPYADSASVNAANIMGLQFLQPLFEFSGACAGCGETPYVKLASQLFGDRMLIANATGCSSIYGGNLPTTPWACNSKGQGPAWANSLFEDNAEFGFGFRIAEDQHKKHAVEALTKMAAIVGNDLANNIIAHMNDSDAKSITEQRARVDELKKLLAKNNSGEAIELASLLEHFVPRSVWIMGGDGWAFDIGFGGLDHVLASDRNVNVLVMDTEVYSNTGGQASKATPIGAVAKFASSGKHIPAKDLGLMMMGYKYVYVAQVAMGANPTQTLKAFREAENYNGPSLIIAYSHCIAHGINMRLGLSQQELAVNCGYWPLYRYNPDLIKEGKNPFILDSKDPTIPLKDYIMNETRFKSLMQVNPKEAEELLQAAQEAVNAKVKAYKKLSEGI